MNNIKEIENITFEQISNLSKGISNKKPQLNLAKEIPMKKSLLRLR